MTDNDIITEGNADGNVDEVVTGQKTEFGLFKAFREGKLDTNILSTQEAISASEIATDGPNSSGSVIPKSWCLPQTNCDSKKSHLNITNNKVTLGALYKPKADQLFCSVAESHPSLVLREKLPSFNESEKESATVSRSVNAILVNQRQRGNALLKHIHNVAWEYSDIEPDYVVGRNHCVYFLSLRYHNLNPEYIFERVRQTKQQYQLSVLLVQVDIADPYYPLKELCKMCLTEKLTLMLAWSPEEAARYIEAYKVLENKPPDDLMPEAASSIDHAAQITDFLTTVRRITRTDAVSIISKFSTVAGFLRAEQSELESCPGVGRLKASKLYETFRMPFLRESN